MTDFINPIPENTKLNILEEIKEYGQKTPRRITIEYKTTGEIEDISEESEGK